MPEELEFSKLSSSGEICLEKKRHGKGITMPDGHLKDFEIMGQVLEDLNELSLKNWREKKDLSGSNLRDDTYQNYEQLTWTNFPLQEKLFKEIIAESYEKRSLSFDESFYLPPLDENKEFIPLLSLISDYQDPLSLQLRIGMYRYEDGDCDKLQCVGFRFEKHGKGNHNYYHVQITKEPHTNGEYQQLVWVPENIPCVILPAKDPVSLLFCMLICLYGIRINEILISPMNIDGKYKEPIKYIGRN